MLYFVFWGRIFSLVFERPFTTSIFFNSLHTTKIKGRLDFAELYFHEYGNQKTKETYIQQTSYSSRVSTINKITKLVNTIVNREAKALFILTVVHRFNKVYYIINNVTWYGHAKCCKSEKFSRTNIKNVQTSLTMSLKGSPAYITQFRN